MVESLFPGLSSLIPGLTAGVRTALPYLTKLSGQGTVLSSSHVAARLLGGLPERVPVLSANEVIRQLRSAGFSVRRQTALQAIKAHRSSLALSDTLNSAGRSIKPRLAQVPLSTHKQKTKYYIKATVRVYNSELDASELRHITLQSDRLMSAGQIQDTIAAAYATAEQYSGLEYEAHLITGYTLINPAIQ